MLAGLVLQAAGASVAMVGFAKTWGQHHGEESFWAPVIRLAQRLRDRLRDPWLRAKQWFVIKVLRRTFHRNVQAADGAVATDATIGLEVSRSPVPPRLTALAKGLADLAAVVEQQREDSRIDHERMKAALGGHSVRLEQATRELAIGGLRLQVWGLFLITIGALLAGIPSLLTIGNSSSHGDPGRPSSVASQGCDGQQDQGRPRAR